MKRQLFKMAGVLTFLVLGLTLAGCTTVESISRSGDGNFPNIGVPNKDFESKGLVFAEWTSEGDKVGNERGEIYTYYKLLQEAKKLGADTIVNVVIESVVIGETEKGQFTKRAYKSWPAKTTWFGTGTAIVYTKALTGETPASSAGSSDSDSAAPGTSSSKKVWWNPFTWFKK